MNNGVNGIPPGKAAQLQEYLRTLGVSMGQIPFFNGSTGRWEATTAPGGAGLLVFDANGVPTPYTTGTTGHVLTKNASGPPTFQAAAGGGLGIKSAKTSDQTFTTTSLADVTNLSLSLAASTSYLVVVLANRLGSSSSHHAKFGWTYPSGCAGFWGGGSENGMSYQQGMLLYGAIAGGSGVGTELSESGVLDVTTDTTRRPHFLIGRFTTTNAGTLQLQAALYTGSGTLTIGAGVIIAL